MNAPTAAHGRNRLRSHVDHAAIAVLRSAMADRHPEKAARELLATVAGDHRVLTLVRAKLSRAALERPTRITERATRILDHALSVTAVSHRQSPAFIPRQRGRDA